ncbi:MAG: substrate-binding domain-containing protein [Candidatus Caenarcaniphilales bacterium]|nr:substrate-binding domain-containing protein [Candidatus Caenarcaniphilales bacterium]
MSLTELEVRKNIILTILDFSTHIDRYSDTEISDTQKSELMSLALAINNLIKHLSSPMAEISSYNNGKYIAPRHNNYLRVKRAAELVLYYRSDLNTISMDLGVSLADASNLVDIAIEYISENIPLKDYKKVIAKKTPRANPQAQAAAQQAAPESKSIGCMAPILFLIMLSAIGYLIYDRFFNNHATNLTSLMNEYRSDRNLSSLSVASKSKEIRINGSSSLVRIFDDYKSGFNIDNPGLELSLEKSDSSMAISNLIEGKIELASCSRIPTIAERKRAIKISGKELVDHKMALDVVVIVVNKLNPVSVLSVEDLQKIYSKEAVSWSEFGGNQSEVKKYSKTFHHGTVSFFRERVLYGDKFASDVTQIYDVNQVMDFVESEPNAISFASLGDVKGRDLKILKISTIFEEKGIAPVIISEENGVKKITIDTEKVRKGQYPLSRYLYLVSLGKLTTNVAKFIDYMRSGSVQSQLYKYNFVSIYD